MVDKDSVYDVIEAKLFLKPNVRGIVFFGEGRDHVGF
jgi:hypothetical protein